MKFQPVVCYVTAVGMIESNSLLAEQVVPEKHWPIKYEQEKIQILDADALN
ncbi:hypothetical protein H6F79_16075 [Trichocoleus sp. FACHB-69]|uniref:hypothetical protein n=1 Tax=Trichocoleus sp. FACHB-69 TaxID=2692874 RepID=UPI0019C14DD1|nr:hypothetical protein [Trichocoleus sp. FACHB-69]MBD1933321.1 hypothetical protein [Trichocoleus sp. FACHB-69]